MNGQLANNIMASQPTATEIERLMRIERAAREMMELLDDGGPEQWGAHLIDSDDNPGQRLRQALGGFD